MIDKMKLSTILESELRESIFEALGKGPHKFKEFWTNSSLEFRKPFRLFYDETLSIFNSEHLD